MLFSWGPVLCLFAAGFLPTVWTFLRDGDPGWIIHLGIIHFVALSLLFYGYSRYRYPVEPLCVLLAVATILSVRTRFGHSAKYAVGEPVKLTR